uniref:FecR domain-containing protein n=1 Tax=Cellvibrio fontiphilus TaxID=1815559 RepID=UPI002B4C1400|nr:FecR domain-containing protein [Cellvibrio fontiphilus]
MHNRALLAPPPEVIARAAAWLVQMQEGKLTAETERQLQAWRLENAEHERAWQAAMQLQDMMGSVPSGLGQSVLGRQRLDRRQLLLSIAVIATALPITWVAYRQLPMLTADYRTATGEQRQIILPDGSQLRLNTGSLVDVRFDAQQRLIRLHRGEIAIQTAPDNFIQENSTHKRPLIVATPVGNIRALGTRFAVRTLDSDISQVEVYEHAVALKPAEGEIETRVDAGKKALFDRQKIHFVEDHHQFTAAWANGQIIADNQRLGDFIAELARYHSGVLRCDPAVAELRISGVFQLKNPLQVLNVVAGTLPVRISRITDYWVTITSP